MRFTYDGEKERAKLESVGIKNVILSLLIKVLLSHTHTPCPFVYILILLFILFNIRGFGFDLYFTTKNRQFAD